MELTQLEDLFVDIGGRFRSSAFDMREKLAQVSALVMDWDGVFNDGKKLQQQSSTFSEVDALGVNLLRFGYFLDRKTLPTTAVITGEENPLAIRFAERENFDAIYIGVQDKEDALDHMLREFGLSQEQLTYFFDDVLDIPLAQKVGLRLTVKRPCNPVFNNYIDQHHLTDYWSGCQGSQHAVREFCELLLCLLGNQDKVIGHRAEYDDFYQEYMQRRRQTKCRLFEYDGGHFIERSPEEIR